MTPIAVDARRVTLTSPIDFGDTHRVTNEHLDRVSREHPGDTLCILLSPGTPAMQAVWILLGKTKYPAVFYQSSIEQGVEQIEIPFDISAEFLPDLAARSDRQVGELAAASVPIDAAFDDILTTDKVMRGLIVQANVIAKRNVPVLIHGETGTGKELFATAIHNASSRRSGPFIAVNCGAIPRELIDSALFGHLKGAFTGAATARKGYFEEADGGTLLLDELGELPVEAQVRLLRVIQNGTFAPVGGSVTRSVDVRIIAATNRDLTEEVAAGRFREDLFYRIAVAVLNLPPLRKRPTDLTVLADALIDKINRDAGGQPGFIKKEISSDAKDLIIQLPWPGNVRELYSTLLRASLWSPGALIRAPDVEAVLFQHTAKNQSLLDRSFQEGFSIQSVIDEVVQHYTRRALTQAEGNHSKAANLLGLASYQTLKNWMKKAPSDHVTGMILAISLP